MSIFINKVFMKNLIKERLKQLAVLLEGVYASNAELERFRYKMAKYKQEFTEPYFTNIAQGDGPYVIRFDRHGNSSPEPKRGDASTLRTRTGDRGAKGGNFISFNIMVYRGLEHGGTYKERTGDAKTRKGRRVKDGEIGSPFSDAEIKAVIAYGDQILNFMKEGTYIDGSAKDIAAAKNDPELFKSAEEERTRRERKAKRGIESLEELGPLQDEMRELNLQIKKLKDKKRRTEGRENRDAIQVQIVELKDEIKEIKTKIQGFSADWDKFRKSKDKSIGI
jgi:hypothetical protein